MLSSYRVLDLTDDRGDLTGFVLAQLGAEVIAIEPGDDRNTGDHGPYLGDRPDPEHRVRRWAYGRGKKSVRSAAVDLAALVATADVVLTSGTRPVDLDAFRELHPALITVAISAFGSDGPKAGWLADDLTLAAASGQAVLTGDADRPPVRISEPQAFLHAAADAAVAVLAALNERSRSGLGQHLDVSAQQSFMAATQFHMLASAVGAPLGRRLSGGQRIGPYELRFVYRARDGHVSILFLFGDMIGRFTQRLMTWIHEEGYCSDELAGQDYVSFFELLFSGRLDPSVLDEATAALAAFVATRTKAELLAAARERRLLIAPVATMREVLDFEQFAFDEFWDEVSVDLPSPTDTVPTGPLRLPGPWARAGVPLRRFGPPAAIGAHDHELATMLQRRPDVPPQPAGQRSAPTGERGPRALDGLKILDLSWVLAGPGATRILADHGATVVRVESEVRTDPMRAAGPFMAGLGGPDDTVLWHCVAAGKYGLQLDLSTEAGRSVAHRLVRWADVVYESFTPGVMDRMGLGFETLRALNPSVVLVSTSLMGQQGPFADFSGFGNLAAAITGFVGLTGWPDRDPAGPFTAYTDYVSPRFAALAILAAHDHARRTGEGQHIDLSQAEASLHFLSPALLELQVGHREATRNGNRDRYRAPHGIYPAGAAGEDRWIAVSCSGDTEWRRLCGMLERPDLATMDTPERHRRANELDRVLSGWTAGQDPERLAERLQLAGVAAHAVQHAPQCLADPQLAHRGQFSRAPHAVHGMAWVEGPTVRFSRTPGFAAWAGPPLGHHTMEVLTTMAGLDEIAVAELVVAGAIR